MVKFEPGKPWQGLAFERQHGRFAALVTNRPARSWLERLASRIRQVAWRRSGRSGHPADGPGRNAISAEGGIADVSNPASGSAVEADAVLRRLARRALGLSGADIERLVREARQRARREQRALTFGDLDRLLSSSRPAVTPGKRRRIAVHEAGHMLARILLEVGEVTAVTIDNVNGGYTEAISADDVLDSAERCEHYLQVSMAGRAAEQIVYGSTFSGSGGFAQSDLAKATQLATAMETSLGFGASLPLLYRDPEHWEAMLRQDRDLARRVHRRLERAERSARRLIRRHRAGLDVIAAELEARGTLEGPELAALVVRVRAWLRRPSTGPA